MSGADPEETDYDLIDFELGQLQYENELEDSPDKRPLREIFPTMNGHRTAACPYCGARCGWHDRDQAYVCANLTKGSGHPTEGYKVAFR